jgi:hypothetical protein
MRYSTSVDKVAWRIVDGEGVLLHAESSAYYGLNRIGTILWERLAATPMSAEELTNWAMAALSQKGDSIRSDIQAFLDHLQSMDLVEQHPATPAAQVPDLPAGLAGLHWEAPVLMPFGELEKLILSGE